MNRTDTDLILASSNRIAIFVLIHIAYLPTLMIQLKKCIKSFSFAFKGIGFLVKHENNFRIHLLASLLIIMVGFVCHIHQSEWLWILLSIALVWITEAINTAMERLVDMVSPSWNRQAGTIKDITAGAVLMAAVFALIVAVIIFYDKLSVM